MAAVITATPATLSASLAAARAGDTVRLQAGDYAPLALRNRFFAPPLTIDATGATLARGVLERVQGVTVIGGRWADAVGIGRNGQLMVVAKSRNVQLIGGDYSNAAEVGVAIGGSRNVVVRDATFTKMQADGINIVSSQNVTIDGAVCSGFTPKSGAHPDCIQGWTVAGSPLNATIAIRNLVSTGQMQGIFFGNPEKGGAYGVTITGSRIKSNYFNGIGLWSCRACVVADNIVSAPEDAPAGSIIRIVGGSVRLARNFVGGLPWRSTAGDTLVEEAFDMALFVAPSAAPEPASWAMMVGGMAMIGSALRRRSCRAQRPAAGRT